MRPSRPPDRLTIHDLAVEARLGAFDWERKAAQTVWIDLELAIDAARAAARDDVRDAIDYAQLAASVKRLVERRPYALLETVAEAIAGLILKEFGVSEVRVRVKKRALPGIDYAAVEVERNARPPSLRSGRRLEAGGRRRRLRAGAG